MLTVHTDSFATKFSPMSASDAPSPSHLGYSPGPPGYVAKQDMRHTSSELAGTTEYELDGGQKFSAYKPERGAGVSEMAGTTEYELDGGQRYHAYKPERGLGIHEVA